MVPMRKSFWFEEGLRYHEELFYTLFDYTINGFWGGFCVEPIPDCVTYRIMTLVLKLRFCNSALVFFL